ncbi:hypothetical protein HOY82DRAFT_605725 [Tuber indicum]|nr:hypothetical protein HOY82DRAFT_605725 [Tuber indicum]
MVSTRNGVSLLGLLLLFSPVAYGHDAGPTEDFLARKDGMLYIAGGTVKHPLGERNWDGPNPVLRSLNISRSFDTSLGSASFIRTEEVPGMIPGVADAAFFPTESGLDLTFGMWRPYNSSIHGRGDALIEDKK